jgi:hypothetical protein
METTELRPLSLGELLDHTFSLYRRNFWLFVGIMVIPSVVSVPFNIGFLSLSNPKLGGRSSIATWLFVGAFFCLFWTMYSLAIGATTYAVSEVYLGRQATVRASYRKVGHKLWRIIGVVLNIGIRMIGILIIGGFAIAVLVGVSAVAARSAGGVAAGAMVGIAVALAYLFLLVFFVVWSLRYAVSISALLLENLGVLAAIRRSVQLTRGRKWQIFVAVLLSLIIGYAGIIIFQGPLVAATMFSAQRGVQPSRLLLFASSTFGAVGGAITMPVMMIVLVLCYYDTRIRKEGFDLQFMMASLDQPIAAPRAASPG